MLKFFLAGKGSLPENDLLPKTLRFGGDPAQQGTFHENWLLRGGYLYGY